ncbi:MAG: 3-isopropylmalate dehydratase small subunit [Desulfobacterales bacterium]|jgi:3-isopropylmalate/(R)-2-methylmalate dehydratase small subunit|nr:3-isopropylmalate dehydratase small subunit [Desulfobacterales bacterium]
MKSFGGSVLFLNRPDINTDEIIPAKYLTEIEREALKPYLFEDLKLDGFAPHRDIPGREVIISRANFGCGSSREHAPWALEANGIRLIIAESFARIFRQNMFNCGLLAVELPAETIDRLVTEFAQRATVATADVARSVLAIRADGRTEEIPFTLAEFDRALVEAGGWLEYADTNY